MLLHMTNSYKWATMAPTVPYGKDRENKSRDSLKNRRIRSIYQYDNLQRWLCYLGSPLDCKETMPLAYHLGKIVYMRNVDSLSNNTKLQVRMNACSILCANAWMVSAWLTVLRKHERQHQFHLHKNFWKHRKNYIQKKSTKWTATTSSPYSCTWRTPANGQLWHPRCRIFKKKSYKTLMWTYSRQFQRP